MRAATAVLIMVAPINLVANIVFVYHTPLGFLGSPVAISLTYWIAFFLLALLTYCSPTHKRNKTWGGLQLGIALDIRSSLLFLRLAIPGILMVGTEWSVLKLYRDTLMLRHDTLCSGQHLRSLR